MFVDWQVKELFKRVVTDPHYWVAMILGPCVWLLLWFILGQPSLSGASVQLLLYGVVLYPVLEELAFRGFLQTWLLEKKLFRTAAFSGITRANLATSFLFAAFHLFNQPPIWAAMIFAPSLVFGYLRDRYEAVSPSIIVHAWYNLGFLLLFR